MTLERGAVLRWVLLAAALGVLLAVALPHINPGGDSRYALAWGELLRNGYTPDFSDPSLPSKHPLDLATTIALAVLGPQGAVDGYAVLAVLWLALLLYAAYRLATAVAGPEAGPAGTAAGLVAVALLLAQPRLVTAATNAYHDVSFAGLVVLAGALALEKPRDNQWPVLILLALAGLQRPEAWGLAALYGGWLLRREGSWAQVLPLVLAAPILWVTVDLVLTGDPFQTLDQLRARDSQAAAGFQGPMLAGFGEVGSFPFDDYLDALKTGILEIAGWPLTALAVAAASWGFGSTRAASRPPDRLDAAHRVRLLGIGLLAGIGLFTVIVALGLPFSNRFLLAVGVGTAALGAATIALWHGRTRVIALGAAGIAVLALLPGDLRQIGQVLDKQGDRRAEASALASLADDSTVRRTSRRCVRIRFAASSGGGLANRARTIVAQRLVRDPASIRVRRRVRLSEGTGFFYYAKDIRAPRGASSLERPPWGFTAQC
jgi:hypothetical protein